VVLIRPPRRTDDGAVAVLVAVVVVAVVLPLLALVVDLGLTRTLAARSRGASDAAALAAASHRPSLSDPSSTPLAIADAKALVAANLPTPDGGWAAAWASCVDPAPLPAATVASPGDCISFDYALKQVRVTVPGRQVPSVFAGVLGSSPPEASGTSTASWGDKISPAVGSCVLCVTDSYTSGAQTVRVSGGDAGAGTMIVTWPGRLVVTGGGATFAASWNSIGGNISPLPVKRAVQDYFAPALASLQGSVPYGQTSNPGPTGGCAPGVYQTISGCTSFAAGTYYVTGNPSSTQQVSLNADATDVLLFFTCSASSGATVVAARCPSGRPPRFNGAGGAPHALRAPGGSGFALVFDQGLARTEFLNSSQQLTITGDVYGPDVTLGSGGPGSAVVSGRVVVRGLSGNLSNFLVTMLRVDAPPVTSTGLTDGPVRLVRSG
jgi:Flp pilus assembly protein TadG